MKKWFQARQIPISRGKWGEETICQPTILKDSTHFYSRGEISRSRPKWVENLHLQSFVCGNKTGLRSRFGGKTPHRNLKRPSFLSRHRLNGPDCYFHNGLQIFWGGLPKMHCSPVVQSVPFVYIGWNEWSRYFWVSWSIRIVCTRSGYFHVSRWVLQNLRWMHWYVRDTDDSAKHDHFIAIYFVAWFPQESRSLAPKSATLKA